MQPPIKLRPIKVGQTFTCTYPGTNGRIEIYTRLPDATEPLWYYEPFVIRAHGSAYKDEMTFEQGQKWFEVRGFIAVC